jgi:predicted permease
MLQDFARGLRLIRNSPRLVIIAVATIAVGVAAPTIMFSIVRGFLRDLPFEQGDRLVYVTRSELLGGATDIGLSPAEVREWASTQRSFEQLAAFAVAPFTVGGSDVTPARYTGARMNASGFRALRVSAQLGRVYEASDEAPAAQPTVVISDRLWRNALGGTPGVVGSTINVDGRPTRIAGVMASGFHFPFNEDLWVPVSLNRATSGADTVRAFRAVGRLKPDVELSQARSDLALLGERTAASEGKKDLAVRTVSFKESRIEPSDVALFEAMVLVVTLVLVVACANVGNLLLVRASARTPMFAVKRALGASPGSIVREIMCESAVIALGGGIGGLLLATFGIQVVNSVLASRIPYFWMTIALDGRVMVFACLLTAIAVLLAGAGPAFHTARVNPQQVLRASGRGTLGGGPRRLTDVMIVGEIAVTFVVLVVAGLVAKGAAGESRTLLAFDERGIATAAIDLNPVLYGDTARVAAIARLLDLLGTDPALTSAAVSTTLPGASANPTRIAFAGQQYLRKEDRPTTRFAVVSSGFGQMLGLRITAGRFLNGSDTRGSSLVAVVNQSFADAHFARGKTPVGARLHLSALGDSSWLTIVGVVATAGATSRAKGVAEAVYLSAAQLPPTELYVLARPRGSLIPPLEPVMRRIRQIGSGIPIHDVRGLSAALDEARVLPRFFAALFASFGLAGLLMAMVGLYGVISFLTRARTRELSIRNAMGAPPLRLGAFVARRSAGQVALGIALGIAMSVPVTPLLASVLFGADPHDVSIQIVVGGAVCVAALAAITAPIVRAVRLPPAAALRVG